MKLCPHPVVAMCLAIVIGFGCGGGGSTSTSGIASATSGPTGDDTATNTAATAGTGATTSSAGTATAPTAKSVMDVSSNVTAYGQALAANSFTAFGPRVQITGEFYDPILGLWATIKTGSAHFQESLFVDQAETLPAGTLIHKPNDAALTLTGSIDVTQNLYLGLSGSYSQAAKGSGFNGSINYSIPNVGTTVCQFEEQPNSSGILVGTGSIGIALQNGYSQTEALTYNADSSISVTSSDSVSCSTAVKITSAFSLSGTITGSDPGLPATIACGPNGEGTVTFADKSVRAIVNWQCS